jgi:hypothetical protein
MPRTIDITRGIEAFDDHTDFSRGNKDRQQFGKTVNTDQFHLGSEYDHQAPVETKPPVEETKPPATEPPAAKFTHKLANGETLEAATVEELATKIEKALQTPVSAPLDFEDKPLYTPTEFKRKELTLAEQAEILNVWKENPQKAARMLQEAEFGAPLDTILQNLSRAELRELHRKQEEAGAEFMMECETYKPTRENAKKLTDLLNSKVKPITKHNLLVAFQQLSATDKTLVRSQEPDEVLPPEDISEVPPPPSSLPSNQGRQEAQPQGTIDAGKFAAMSLADQKKVFADLRRKGA